ncbi:hypothetical protein BH23CHL2_BH23CHL2_18380 [soil metagenome]
MLGPLTSLNLTGMVRPAPEYDLDNLEPLLPRDATLADHQRFLDRHARTIEIACSHGLRYVIPFATKKKDVPCHACGAPLGVFDPQVGISVNVTDGRC